MNNDIKHLPNGDFEVIHNGQIKSEGYPFSSYFADNACPDCDNGQVDLMIQGEVVETITCSTCNGQGWLIPSERAKIMEGHRCLSAAIADSEGFK